MRLIDADEYEKRIKPYDTEDDMDKALYNFAHYHLVTTPSAQPERKKGKWKEDGRSWGTDWWKCTVCEETQRDVPTIMGVPKWNFCPNCGAKMVDSQESEEGAEDA